MSTLSDHMYTALNPKIKYEDSINDTDGLIIFNHVIKEHNVIAKRFPVWLDLCCYYEMHEYAYTVAVDLYGLPHGECVFQDMFNKPCGFADELSPDELSDIMYTKSNNEEEKALLISSIKERLGDNMPCYSHSHIGNWFGLYLDKAGVDTSYERYYFKTEEMLKRFKIKMVLPKYELLN